MNKVKTIKIKNEDGSISEESYALAANALNIDMANGKNVQETIGTIDVDNDGNVATQLNKKMWYFNDIASIKKTNLQLDNICELIVNHEVIGTYKIVDDNTLIIDDYNTIKLNNGLYAIKIKQKWEKEKLFGMKINSTRIFRKLFETGVNILNPMGNYYSNNQGFCMINENIAVLALIEGSKNYTNNNTRIIAVNINTGEIIKEIIDEFGHANDLSYNPDTKEIYVGGCGTYNSQGALIESNKLMVIDYDTFTIKGTYQMPNTIAGICYDRKTKKLWANNHIAVFELNMANYSIVRTIHLRGYSYYSGSVGQTVKVFNNIIYRVTAFPNELNIFDINGNFINRFVFNDFMDDSFYIGELETIDMIDDYMYFNGQVRSFDFCPLAMVNIGKTSLKYNIANNNKIFNLKPYGSITLNVDNSIDIPNPDGSSDKPFKELVEAIAFLNSPIGLKMEALIRLTNTNIEYKGCLINANNIQSLQCNAQTIGSLKIEGVSHVQIDQCFYKGTISNKPNLTIVNSTGVKLYRPNFINNNTGSNYGLEISNSEIMIGSTNGGSNTDSSDNLLIHIPNCSTLLTKQYKTNNIIVDNSAAIIKEMTIFEGALNSDQQTAAYTCNIGTANILEQIERYKYIIFEFSMPNTVKRIKIKTNGIQYRISEMRSNNSTTAAWLRFYSYMIKFTAQNVMVEYGKQITQNLDEDTKEIITSSMEGYISKISLTDF